MTTTAAVEMAEFVLLWDAVQQLTNEFPDSISWRWTSGDTLLSPLTKLSYFAPTALSRAPGFGKRSAKQNPDSG